MAGGRRGICGVNNHAVDAPATITEEEPTLGNNVEVPRGFLTASQATWLEAILARIQELEQAKVEQDRLTVESIRENERLRDEPPNKRVRSGLEKGTKLETPLYKKPPGDLIEVMARSDAIIGAEERGPLLKLTSTLGHGSGTQIKKGPDTGRSDGEKVADGGQTYRLNGGIVNVHPITIWRENKDLFKVPNPILQDMSARDRSKKCDFHNDVGHNNDECRSLRNQVSVMIGKGLLRKYVVQKSERPGSSV